MVFDTARNTFEGRNSIFVEAVFFQSHEGNLDGVICCQVDDILWGGSVTLNLKMKCETVTLKFNNLGDMASFNIVIYSDVSLGNLKDGGSQRGFLIFLEGENKKFGLVYCQSSKVKRVVKSTLVGSV